MFVTPPYTILLATYNGANYLFDFLQSCSFTKDADIVVRDDGSSDETLAIIQNYAKAYNIELKILTGEKLGARGNFSKLLEQVEKPYFFFADQDDIWEKHKIPTMLQVMQELESKYGQNTPLLVYSDASLMSEDGNIFHNSFYKASTLPYKWNESFRNILVMPHVPGCTMLGNRALAKAAFPVPEQAIMHDCWVLQIAGALGKIVEVTMPLVRYRQHSSNAMGANVLTLRNIVKKTLDLRKSRRKGIIQSQRQAMALLGHCGHMMDFEKQKICNAWGMAERKSWLSRRIVYLKYGFRKAGFIHNAVLWIYG